MPTNIAGSALISVVNPDGTNVGGATGNVVVTNTPLPVSTGSTT